MSKYRILVYEQEEISPAQVLGGSASITPLAESHVWYLRHDTVEEGNDPVEAVRSMLEMHDIATKQLNESDPNE